MCLPGHGAMLFSQRDEGAYSGDNQYSGYNGAEDGSIKLGPSRIHQMG